MGQFHNVKVLIIFDFLSHSLECYQFKYNDMSDMWKLKSVDFVKGLVVAVAVVVLGMLQDGLTTNGLAFAAYDWAGILDVAWKAGVAYLGKNLLTDGEGKVLGKIG